jgi:hypothetical protein
MSCRKIYLLISISLVFLSCASTSVVLLDETLKYPPSEKVEILVEKPIKEYKIIAKLETKGYKGTSQTTILNNMRQKAKLIGADAIIPFEDASEYQSPGVIYNPWLGGYQTLPGGKIPILRGYAIKYITSYSSIQLDDEIHPKTTFNNSKNYANSTLKQAQEIDNEYLNIKKIYQEFLLLQISPTTPMKIGDEFIIVRYEKQNNNEYGYSSLGIGRVIKIRDDNAILRYNLFDKNVALSMSDKIEYNYNK